MSSDNIDITISGILDRLSALERFMRASDGRSSSNGELRIALDYANAQVEKLLEEKKIVQQKLDLCERSDADRGLEFNALRQELENLIAGFDMLAQKMADPFFFAQGKVTSYQVRGEIYSVLNESPSWREAVVQRAKRAVLHVRKPSEGEGE